MTQKILVDTGLSSRFLNGRDRYHGWSKEVFSEVEAAVLTFEAVVSEVASG